MRNIAIGRRAHSTPAFASYLGIAAFSSIFFASSFAFADDVSTATVRVASDDGPVNIEARSHRDASWTVVCTGLCDQPLPLDAEYRVNAQGVASSEPFRLEPKDDVTLAVRTHHNGRFAAGIVLVSLGSVLLAGSTASGILALALAEGGSFAAIPFALIAAAGGVVGTSALVPGILLMSHGSTTNVEQVSNARPIMVPLLSGTF